MWLFTGTAYQPLYNQYRFGVRNVTGRVVHHFIYMSVCISLSIRFFLGSITVYNQDFTYLAFDQTILLFYENAIQDAASLFFTSILTQMPVILRFHMLKFDPQIFAHFFSLIVINRKGFYQLNPSFRLSSIMHHNDSFLMLFNAIGKKLRQLWYCTETIQFQQAVIPLFPTLSRTIRCRLLCFVFCLDCFNNAYLVVFILLYFVGASKIIPLILFDSRRSILHSTFITAAGVGYVYILYDTMLQCFIVVQSLFVVAFVNQHFFRENNIMLRYQMQRLAISTSRRGDSLPLIVKWHRFQREHHRFAMLARCLNSKLVSPVFCSVIATTIGFCIYISTILLLRHLDFIIRTMMTIVVTVLTLAFLFSVKPLLTIMRSLRSCRRLIPSSQALLVGNSAFKFKLATLYEQVNQSENSSFDSFSIGPIGKITSFNVLKICLIYLSFIMMLILFVTS